MKELTWLFFGVLNSLDSPHFGANQVFCRRWELSVTLPQALQSAAIYQDRTMRGRLQETGTANMRNSGPIIFIYFFTFCVIQYFIYKDFSLGRYLLKGCGTQLPATLSSYLFLFLIFFFIHTWVFIYMHTCVYVHFQSILYCAMIQFIFRWIVDVQ